MQIAQQLETLLLQEDLSLVSSQDPHQVGYKCLKLQFKESDKPLSASKEKLHVDARDTDNLKKKIVHQKLHSDSLPFATIFCLFLNENEKQKVLSKL